MSQLGIKPAPQAFTPRHSRWVLVFKVLAVGSFAPGYCMLAPASIVGLLALLAAPVVFALGLVVWVKSLLLSMLGSGSAEPWPFPPFRLSAVMLFLGACAPLSWPVALLFIEIIAVAGLFFKRRRWHLLLPILAIAGGATLWWAANTHPDKLMRVETSSRWWPSTWQGVAVSMVSGGVFCLLSFLLSGAVTKREERLSKHLPDEQPTPHTP